MTKKSDRTVLLLENEIFSKSKSLLLKTLKDRVIRTKKPLVIFTPNPEQLVLAQKSPRFQAALQRADYTIPDGIGLFWAAKMLSIFGKGQPIFERISGIDLATDLLEWAAMKDWSVLLLGGKDYHQAKKQPIDLPMSGKAAQKLRLQWLEGYQNVVQPTDHEEQIVTKTLRTAKPKMVFVAFGAPQQEQWVVEHLDLLKKSDVSLVMVVGGSFDVLFGRLRRAPLWMRAIGLEWLFRLIQEPSRWKRQLALLEFIRLVFWELFRPKKA